VVVQYDFDQLVAEADAIVHARVVEQHSEWQDQRIVTQVVLEVIECSKGSYAAGDRVTIEQAGGVVGDLAMVVPGEPTFTTGEEVVLFLEVEPAVADPLVLGMGQGKFSVVADPASGQAMVTRSLDGMTLVSPDGQLLPSPLETPTSELPAGIEISELIRSEILQGPLVVPLDDFMGEIRRTLTRVEGF
jgi:hypothetical protein